MTAVPLPSAPEWMADALCAQVDLDLFFPEKGGGTRQAKAVCNGGPRRHGDPRPPCPVREQCLRYALDHDERFGIWGGLSERERRQLRPEPTPKPTVAAQAARMADKGMPRKVIADHLDVHPDTVSRALRPVREPRPQRPFTTAEQRDAIRVCAEAGMTTGEIAEQLGVSANTVRRWAS